MLCIVFPREKMLFTELTPMLSKLKWFNPLAIFFNFKKAIFTCKCTLFLWSIRAELALKAAPHSGHKKSFKVP